MMLWTYSGAWSTTVVDGVQWVHDQGEWVTLEAYERTAIRRAPGWIYAHV